MRTRVTVVRRHPEPMKGAAVVGSDGLMDALEGADGVVLALPLVSETVGIIGEAQLAAMESHAWLVNVTAAPMSTPTPSSPRCATARSVAPVST